LASRYTSYVAVDPKEQKELKESWMMMKSRDVPVQLAHGWGGYQALGAFAGGCGPMMGRSNCPPMAMACHYSLPPGIDLVLVCVTKYRLDIEDVILLSGIYTDGVEQVGGGGGEAYESCSDNSTYCVHFQGHLRTFLQITTGNVSILFEII
jgi:hypothetical protein